MTIDLIIRNKVIEAIDSLYGQHTTGDIVQVQITRKEFEGDITHDSNFSHITITLSAPMSGKAILN